MTTTVIVQAHCSSDIEVKVRLKDSSGKVVEEVTLQDKEETMKYIYDDREISVKEVKKESTGD